ncbi:hypothetical protein BGLT_01881 [Caballeronia glathei]|jgi:hypothetical protein|uniref:DUF4148 domain-containing protein n=1 Tax=Caballeronia glathei TaxID=60547 RepID=A0A069PNH9_9BURK|nr:DUF4148 domain-containing protein [Caballeronia glathei]KDR42017.1 hypothetical protein BG61_13975 [Caballeronia glathei]CDY79187.1 hypothetical protein BGLT_01881 [Caballeronia glathei]
MKILSRLFPGAVAIAIAGAWCATSAFAQPPSRYYDPSAPMTRAEVKADLVAWIKAGYDPNDWLNYPENAQRAGRIVAAQRAQAAGSGIQ